MNVPFMPEHRTAPRLFPRGTALPAEQTAEPHYYALRETVNRPPTMPAPAATTRQHAK